MACITVFCTNAAFSRIGACITCIHAVCTMHVCMQLYTAYMHAIVYCTLACLHEIKYIEVGWLHVSRVNNMADNEIGFIIDY